MLCNLWPPAIQCAVWHLSVFTSCLNSRPPKELSEAAAFGKVHSGRSESHHIFWPFSPSLKANTDLQTIVSTFFDSVMHPLLHQSVFHASYFLRSGQDIKRQHERQTLATARHIAFQGRKRTTFVPLARKDGESAVQDKPSRGVGLGDLLGPIGLSLGRGKDAEVRGCSCKAFPLHDPRERLTHRPTAHIVSTCRMMRTRGEQAMGEQALMTEVKTDRKQIPTQIVRGLSSGPLR